MMRNPLHLVTLALLAAAGQAVVAQQEGGEQPEMEKIIVSLPNGEKVERLVPKSSPLFKGFGSSGPSLSGGGTSPGTNATKSGPDSGMSNTGGARTRIPNDDGDALADEWGGFTGFGDDGKNGGGSPEGEIGSGKKKFQFTDFIASGDTRKVYVSSSSGDDNNSGLSPDKPVKTVERGKSLLRDRQPDWLLFKRGDVWDTGLGIWKLSGRAEGEPMVVSYYGDSGPQPVFKSGVWVSGGNGTPTKLSNLAFVGLDFYAAKRDPNSPEYQGPTAGGDGFLWIRSGENLLIEGCRFRYFKTGMMFQGEAGGMKNVTIRGCVVSDSYGVKGSFHSSGIYVANLQNLVIAESVFDHNGWNKQVTEAEPTIYNHNLYIDFGNQWGDTKGVKVIGNVISRGASHGLQLRPGGVARGNLFVQNAIAAFVAKDESIFLNNVVLDPRDITPSQPRGWGLEVIGSTSATIRGNIVAHKKPGVGDGVAIRVSKDAGLNVPKYEILVENNLVYGWNGSSFATVTDKFDSVTVRRNCFQNLAFPTTCVWLSSNPGLNSMSFSENVYYSIKNPGEWIQIGNTGQKFTVNGWNTFAGDSSISKQMTFVDPNRTIETYHASLGRTATFEGFMAQAREQSKVNWRNEYRGRVVNNYIRKGFEPAGN